MASISPPDGSAAPLAKAQRDGEWIGRVIGGKYVVEEILGRGGMGVVVKARHLRLEEPVAIKILHQSLAGDDVMVARMLREARAMLRISSEHIVRMMDVDVLDDGTPYLVFEHLTGTDLRALLERRGAALTWEEAVAIADHVCCALAEAHALGIVHRDLKPSNLFIVDRPDGRRIVKLLDFGISKLSAPGESAITATGLLIGSPRYMAPEQLRAQPVDGRTDLWSVGVVLYEMLTAKLPFEGGDIFHTAQSVTEDTHEPIQSLVPGVPAEICAIVDRCLQKDPELRYPDVIALREALAPFDVVPPRSGVRPSLPDFGRPRLGSQYPFAPESGPVSVRLSSQVPASPRAVPAERPPIVEEMDLQPAPDIAPPAPPAPIVIEAPRSIDADRPSMETAARISVLERARRSSTFAWFAMAGLLVGILIGIALLLLK